MPDSILENGISKPRAPTKILQHLSLDKGGQRSCEGLHQGKA